MTTHAGEKKSRFDPEPMPRRDFLGLAAMGSMIAAFALSIFGMLKLPKAAVSASLCEEIQRFAARHACPRARRSFRPDAMSQCFATARASLPYRRFARTWGAS